MGIPEIKSVVSRLGREYGAQRIWLFGSYARGDMTPTSDIDLRIDKAVSVELRWVACSLIWKTRWVCRSI